MHFVDVQTAGDREEQWTEEDDRWDPLEHRTQHDEEQARNGEERPRTSRHFNEQIRELLRESGLRYGLNRIKYHRVPLKRQITGIPEVIAKWRGTFGV